MTILAKRAWMDWKSRFLLTNTKLVYQALSLRITSLTDYYRWYVSNVL